ncbi:uncharacterized protein LAJ45_03804 [Morchella importuna]|uniref:Regulatory P domain-containing protein n=1 Tax=Morchella conica CCBAS932 TaxID=1392247 RepID=A0A3N4KBS8_9PEZI|nr:uncharacterized protein LAJ45_03804 [Morchella importuna]KAH8151813.1 hypothetical protein LAJ45_03804 [Morchella importuna]RPB07956.1 hypothetical protein P167DRAFT_578739 [Morchella conica CCBAS932]
MKFLSVAATALLAAALDSALGGEIANPARQENYDSGEMHMMIMGNKRHSFDIHRETGAYNSSAYPKITKYSPCVDGMAAGQFRCKNVDLAYFASHADLGSITGEGSSSWGWTSPDGREFIIVAQADGASFSEVLPNGHLDYLGRLPQQSTPEIWREIRVMDNYAVIGSEAVDHYVQIFDMRKLLKIKKNQKPKTFSTSKDLTSLFTGLPIGRTHNIVVNNDLKYAVAVGAAPRNSTCKSGLIFIDLTNPSNPTSPGCAEQDGYVHDAQCLLYKGPDTRYHGRDICYGYNEDTLTIYDVTNKKNTTIISRTGYTGASYTHQGWLLDTENQEYLIMDDEYDEYDAVGPAADGFPVTYIWDIKDLTAPKQTGYYKSGQVSIDHNQYVANGKAYQSNYGAGLRILDVSSIPSDPTGAGVKEIGFFDVYPEDDNEPRNGVLDFVGSWSSYALFKSGWIVVNTIERGAFVVKYTGS